MVVKKYICKGCGNTVELDLTKITFPQCRLCCGIMAEVIEYDTPVAAFIPQLEVLWMQHWPGIPIHIQLIYNNRRFKFRWFNGPDVDEVKQNSVFMQGYYEVAEAAGILKNRRTHERIFKHYIGPTVPYRAYADLSADEKVKVASLIEECILTIYREVSVTGTVLRTDENGIPVLAEDGSLILDECSELRDEVFDSEFMHYECDTCHKVIEDANGNVEISDMDVIQHIINYHLN